MDITLYTPRYARREVWRAHERFFLKISIILFLLCLASVEVWGQDRVQLFGVVRDAETKQPIQGATLTVLDSRFVMKTNEWGSMLSKASIKIRWRSLFHVWAMRRWFIRCGN